MSTGSQRTEVFSERELGLKYHSWITRSFYFVTISPHPPNLAKAGDAEPGYVVLVAVFERSLGGPSGERITLERFLSLSGGKTEDELR